MPSFKTLALAALPLATAAPLAGTPTSSAAAAESTSPFVGLISRGAGLRDGLALTVFQTTQDKTLVLQRQTAFDPTPAYVAGEAAALAQREGSLFFQAADGLYGAVLPMVGLGAGSTANVGLQLGKGSASFSLGDDGKRLLVHRESPANTLLACEVTLTAPRAPPASYYQLAIGNANINNTFMEGCAPIELDAYPAKHVYPVPTSSAPPSYSPPAYTSAPPVYTPTQSLSIIAGGSSFLSPSYTTLPAAPNTPSPSIIAGGSSFLSPSYTTLPAAPNTPAPTPYAPSAPAYPGSIIAGGSSFLSPSYTTLPAAPNTPVPTPY